MLNPEEHTSYLSVYWIDLLYDFTKASVLRLPVKSCCKHKVEKLLKERRLRACGQLWHFVLKKKSMRLDCCHWGERKLTLISITFTKISGQNRKKKKPFLATRVFRSLHQSSLWKVFWVCLWMWLTKTRLLISVQPACAMALARPLYFCRYALRVCGPKMVEAPSYRCTWKAAGHVALLTSLWMTDRWFIALQLCLPGIPQMWWCNECKYYSDQQSPLLHLWMHPRTEVPGTHTHTHVVTWHPANGLRAAYFCMCVFMHHLPVSHTLVTFSQTWFCSYAD